MLLLLASTIYIYIVIFDAAFDAKKGVIICANIKLLCLSSINIFAAKAEVAFYSFYIVNVVDDECGTE